MIRRALIADKTIVESSRVSYPSLPQFEVLQANTFVTGVLEYYSSQLGTYVPYIPTTKVGAVLGLKQSTLGTGVSNDWMYFDLFYVVGPDGEKYPEPGSFYIIWTVAVGDNTTEYWTKWTTELPTDQLGKFVGVYEIWGTVEDPWTHTPYSGAILLHRMVVDPVAFVALDYPPLIGKNNSLGYGVISCAWDIGQATQGVVRVLQGGTIRCHKQWRNAGNEGGHKDVMVEYLKQGAVEFSAMQLHEYCGADQEVTTVLDSIVPADASLGFRDVVVGVGTYDPGTGLFDLEVGEVVENAIVIM